MLSLFQEVKSKEFNYNKKLLEKYINLESSCSRSPHDIQ